MMRASGFLLPAGPIPQMHITQIIGAGIIASALVLAVSFCMFLMACIAWRQALWWLGDEPRKNDYRAIGLIVAMWQIGIVFNAILTTVFNKFWP